MARLSEINNVWNTIKEIDLRPLREEAQRGVKIALVGRKGAGKRRLAEQLRRDPSRTDMVTLTPLLVLDLDEPGIQSEQLNAAQIIVLVMRTGETADAQLHHLVSAWNEAGKQVLSLVNTAGLDQAEPESHGGQTAPNQTGAIINLAGFSKERTVVGSVEDAQFLQNSLAPHVLELLPDHHLTLARNFPLFRVPVCRQLISETCFSNATYAFSTGIAEIVPVLVIPLNVADMLVLSKTQAFMVYKLGLAMGFSTDWQKYIKEFGGVLGSGFFWRQLARQMVGLIPIWGIVPKVAVSYAGTYVAGHVVLQWYLTGRHISAQQIRQLYVQAFARGKKLAKSYVEKLPGSRSRKDKRLPAPAKDKKTRAGRCLICGGKNPRKAQYCQHCGHALNQG